MTTAVKSTAHDSRGLEGRHVDLPETSESNTDQHNATTTSQGRQHINELLRAINDNAVNLSDKSVAGLVGTIQETSFNENFRNRYADNVGENSTENHHHRLDSNRSTLNDSWGDRMDTHDGGKNTFSNINSHHIDSTSIDFNASNVNVSSLQMPPMPNFHPGAAPSSHLNDTITSNPKSYAKVLNMQQPLGDPTNQPTTYTPKQTHKIRRTQILRNIDTNIPVGTIIKDLGKQFSHNDPKRILTSVIRDPQYNRRVYVTYLTDQAQDHIMTTGYTIGHYYIRPEDGRISAFIPHLPYWMDIDDATTLLRPYGDLTDYNFKTVEGVRSGGFDFKIKLHPHQTLPTEVTYRDLTFHIKRKDDIQTCTNCKRKGHSYKNCRQRLMTDEKRTVDRLTTKKNALEQDLTTIDDDETLRTFTENLDMAWKQQQQWEESINLELNEENDQTRKEEIQGRKDVESTGYADCILHEEAILEGARKEAGMQKESVKTRIAAADEQITVLMEKIKRREHQQQQHQHQQQPSQQQLPIEQQQEYEKQIQEYKDKTDKLTFEMEEAVLNEKRRFEEEYKTKTTQKYSELLADYDKETANMKNGHDNLTQEVQKLRTQLATHRHDLTEKKKQYITHTDQIEEQRREMDDLQAQLTNHKQELTEKDSQQLHEQQLHEQQLQQRQQQYDDQREHILQLTHRLQEQQQQQQVLSPSPSEDDHDAIYPDSASDSLQVDTVDVPPIPVITIAGHEVKLDQQLHAMAQLSPAAEVQHDTHAPQDTPPTEKPYQRDKHKDTTKGKAKKRLPKPDSPDQPVEERLNDGDLHGVQLIFTNDWKVSSIISNIRSSKKFASPRDYTISESRSPSNLQIVTITSHNKRIANKLHNWGRSVQNNPPHRQYTPRKLTTLIYSDTDA